MHSNRDAKLMSGNFSRLRTSELRQLLNDDQKMSRIIRLSKKFQGLQLTKEDIFVSNCRLAEINLSHQPTLRNGKLKLANKHQEMEKLIISVQAKQDQLSLLEGHMLKMAHGLLLKKIEQNDEHGEVFFQKFVEGRMSVEKFLGRFQNSRCLHHIRLVQAVKTQDILEPTPKEHQISTETHNSERFPLVYPYNPPDTCRVHYSLTVLNFYSLGPWIFTKHPNMYALEFMNRRLGGQRDLPVYKNSTYQQDISSRNHVRRNCLESTVFKCSGSQGELELLTPPDISDRLSIEPPAKCNHGP
ncbi:vacuolar protein sorting-associated protein 37D-like [Hypomesus transpacificus]|uniref:vacuolar protein sorting-associated protein 37D-like n=1 Tax=Hypomesus transpacificus TaxID=137520 RepID=UPI001F076EAE|nr:vacuolar protein sorting-associated protein 37D-like [Hypomesus transpacificus]